MVPAAGQAGDAPGRDAVSETPEKKPKSISEQPCHSAGQRQQGCLLPCTMPRSYRPCLTCGGASQGPAPTPLAAGPPAAGCGRAHASAGAEMGASERDLVQQGTRGEQGFGATYHSLMTQQPSPAARWQGAEPPPGARQSGGCAWAARPAGGLRLPPPSWTRRVPELAGPRRVLALHPDLVTPAG